MKKVTLTLIALTGLFLSASAQTNVPAKPIYQPDVKTPVAVSFTLPAGLLIDYLNLMSKGPALDDATDLSAAQVKKIKTNGAVVISKIDSIVTAWYLDGQKKFTADTLKNRKAVKP